ncbi:hypothetical protein D3C71_1092010 [compost metagenome]
MSQAYEFPVSIVLNKDVILTPETQHLLTGLGIDPKETSQYELVGSVLSHRHVVKSLLVLKMRITAILKSGVPFAGLDDVMAITISNIAPIQTVRYAPEVEQEEVYRVKDPLITNNIGIMPNEELVIRRSGDLLSLAHEQFEIQLKECDLAKIKEKSVRKERYALIMPDESMWRVVSLRAYSLPEVIEQVQVDPCAMICRSDLDTGYYSTSALFKLKRTIYNPDGKKTHVLEWLQHLYLYGEWPDDADLDHPIIQRWKYMHKVPSFDSDEFTQFMAFHVCRYRSLTATVRTEGRMIVTDSGPVRPRDFFAQYDEINHAHQS